MQPQIERRLLSRHPDSSSTFNPPPSEQKAMSARSKDEVVRSQTMNAGQNEQHLIC